MDGGRFKVGESLLLFWGGGGFAWLWFECEDSWKREELFERYICFRVIDDRNGELRTGGW